MKPLAEIYPPRFFSRRYKLHWRANIVRNAIREVIPAKSMIDVGCATGDIVKAFMDKGLCAMGLEGTDACVPHLVIPKAHLIIHDLRKPLDHGLKYELCICFEVMEHIEPEYADILVANLTSLSNSILISAALPGQGGHYHVNCQFPGYWDDKFGNLGYARVQTTAEMIKFGLELWKNKPGIRAYWHNLLFYKRI